MNEDLSFDEWFDIFTGKARELGYDGPIDRDTFKDDYDEDASPQDIAIEFVEEMNG